SGATATAGLKSDGGAGAWGGSALTLITPPSGAPRGERRWAKTSLSPPTTADQTATKLPCGVGATWTPTGSPARGWSALSAVRGAPQEVKRRSGTEWCAGGRRSAACHTARKRPDGVPATDGKSL